MANQLRRFTRDRRGNVLIITAFLLPAFVTCAGMAVDFAMTYQKKASLQQALDAAALAAAKMYGTTQDAAELQKAASAYFYANNGRSVTDNTKLNYDGVATVNGLNVLQISATKDVPTFFGPAIKALTGGAFDYSKAHIGEASKVVIENKSIELALVLDNSGSMREAPDSGGDAKIKTLRDAMTDLATQMMSKNTTSSSNSANVVKIGIVPFSSAVNVGASHADDAWMDTKGLSSIHHENFDWTTWTDGSALPPAFAVPVAANGSTAYRYKTVLGDWLTRFYIYKNAKRNGVRRFGDWKGCVESRPGGLAFTDADATDSNPDSLFVPTFAPDEFDWYSGTSLFAENDYLTDSDKSNSFGSTNLQRLRNMNKYMNSAYASNMTEDKNPDFGCDTSAITPLTTTTATVSGAIAKMLPEGATNIPEGLAWGWRVLSAKEPFTEGKAASAKDNLKVMILVTDGENTYYPTYTNGSAFEVGNYNDVSRSMYGTYGYGQNWSKAAAPVASVGHMFDGLTTTTKKSTAANYYGAMNEMLGKVCTNIKADGKSYKTDGSDGIIVATIAFDLPDGSPVKTLLQNCASKGMNGKGSPLYYDAKSSKDLVSAIQSLVGQISSLRIYR